MVTLKKIYTKNQAISLLYNQLKKGLTLYKNQSTNGWLDQMNIQGFGPELVRLNYENKESLREMLRHSQYWNEYLQSCIIPIQRPILPDSDKLAMTLENLFHHYEDWCWICDMARFLVGDETSNPEFEHDLKEEFPRINLKQKKSSILRQVLVYLNLWSDTDHDVQYWFSKAVQDMRLKHKPEMLYVSINPLHFMTMSNPTSDKRGKMLTSCHSLDNDDMTYSNGCAGYAMDHLTMIAFIPARNKFEDVATRKVMRQIFCYEPDSGILLQSRLYDSEGGTVGFQSLSDFFRPIITNLINECENTPNYEWESEKYHYCHHQSFGNIEFETDSGFGGYPDWHYEKFDPRIAVRVQDNLHSKNVARGVYQTKFYVGNYGICLSCGCETDCDDKIYCHDCHSESSCDWCDCTVYDDDLEEVVNSNGAIIYVCPECRDEHFTQCVDCCQYHYSDNIIRTVDGHDICQSCFDTHYTSCEDCGLAVHFDDATRVQTRYGDAFVCGECLNDNYVELWDGSYMSVDMDFHSCPECGKMVAGWDESELCGRCE